MNSVRLITLLPNSKIASWLELMELATERASEPGSTGIVVVEASTGSEVAGKLRLWNLNPDRTVAVCPIPDGLPPGCFWLAPELLEQPKWQVLLRAWLDDHKKDPMQGLLAQISHDMRSPLSVICTAASLISKFSEDKVKTARYLSLINESSGVLRSLVNDILDYSNIREGEFSFHNLDFDLPHLLQSVTDSFRLLVKSPGLQVTWSADPDVPGFVHGDPGRLRQVLTNLMNNALKFTEAGSVSLEVSVRAGLLRIAVVDTGVGIRPEALEKIFLPYQQADASIHSTFGGTGLGLTICRALVRRMGGDIGVESCFGTGSTFWFTANLPAVVRGTLLVLPELRARKILVGSDNPGLVTTSLAAHNTLVVHRTVDEVAKNLTTEAFDLYIIDLDLSSFENVALLAKEVPNAVLVLFTSAGQRGDVARCKEVGASGYLTTPIEPLELEVALALALDSGSRDIVTKYTAKELLATRAG